MLNLVRRPRRLRRTAALRDLAAEVRLSRRDLIQPLFTVETDSMAGPVGSLPGITRETLDTTLKTVEADLERGLSAFLLFGLPARKDLDGSNAIDPAAFPDRLAGRGPGDSLSDRSARLVDAREQIGRGLARGRAVSLLAGRRDTVFGDRLLEG